MKIKEKAFCFFTACAIVSVILLGCSLTSNETPPPLDGLPELDYPSELLRSRGRLPDISFVVVEEPDLRLLFCDRSRILDRIRRSVCVVDFVGATMAHQTNAAKEISIRGATPIRDVMLMCGLVNWKGGQPQLRLIKHDAIIQSPLVTDTQNTEPDINKFLRQSIEPGDFLIVAAVY
jgi:hypothetical protein